MLHNHAPCKPLMPAGRLRQAADGVRLCHASSQVLARDMRQEAGPPLLEAWLDSVLGGPGPLLAGHAAAADPPLHQAPGSRRGLEAHGLSRQQLAQVRGGAGHAPWQ
jgi:hypothetical protein